MTFSIISRGGFLIMDLNRSILIGNLTRDPESRTTSKGTILANFTVAVNDGYGDKKAVSFIKCTAWRKTAEAVINYCQKGSKVAIEGKLKQQVWKDKEGNNREKIYINVQQVFFLNTRSQGQTQTQGNEGFAEEPGGGYSMDSDVFLDDDAPF